MTSDGQRGSGGMTSGGRRVEAAGRDDGRRVAAMSCDFGANKVSIECLCPCCLHTVLLCIVAVSVEFQFLSHDVCVLLK